jgi:glyoxylase-like metal-dependent hydrolase (beta-lactamase superfamily II)
MAVEFRDFVVVLEGGQSDARGQAILAETKRLFPNKRIRYVVATHPHFDHASGLGPFIADGITVLADDNAKYFLEQALGTPRTLVGDTLAKSKKKPKVEGVVEKQVVTDGTRNLELHHVAGLEHSDSMLIAYLPKEKILFCADFRLPTDQPDPSLVTLRENVERLQLDFDRVVMVHAPNPIDRSRRPTCSARPGGRTDARLRDCRLLCGAPVGRPCDRSCPPLFRRVLPGGRHAGDRGTGRRVPVQEPAHLDSRRSAGPIRAGAHDLRRRVGKRLRASNVKGVLKNTIKAGDRVRLWVSPNRNPNDNRVRLKRIQLPDGRTLGGQNRQQDR